MDIIVGGIVPNVHKDDPCSGGGCTANCGTFCSPVYCPTKICSPICGTFCSPIL